MNGPTLGLIQTHNRRNLWEGLAWISAMIFTFVIAWTNIGVAFLSPLQLSPRHNSELLVCHLSGYDLVARVLCLF